MNNFQYINVKTKMDAIRLLNGNGHAALIAGGTDLLTRMKLGIIRPERVINLKTVPEMDSIRYDDAAGLTVGALATLNEVANNILVHEKYPVLFQALRSAASPQIRNRGTIGGNLSQGSRCWYYRGRFDCWLKGGETCYAKKGENRQHAIYGDGPCYTVHPSDPAVALIALDAEVTIENMRKERRMPLELFFQLPQPSSRQLTVLNKGDIITAIRIPGVLSTSTSRGIYIKAMDRQAWAFALASVAVQLTVENNVLQNVRIVLGGVAPKPLRVTETETYLWGRRLDDVNIEKTAEAVVAGAKPLAHNGYKRALVKGIVKEALYRLKQITKI